ncbi:MAG: hypothetical protein M5F18_13645 [Asgard group archaeon]|nr:hypothetical protein [Asgard group archaeon]
MGRVGSYNQGNGRATCAFILVVVVVLNLSYCAGYKEKKTCEMNKNKKKGEGTKRSNRSSNNKLQEYLDVWGGN